MTGKSPASCWCFLLGLGICIDIIWCQLPGIVPGKFAPSFALQTLKGRIIYLKHHQNTAKPRHPVIFHAFTRNSAFLETMWRDDLSLKKFLELSPRNTHYVFMSFRESAKNDALWMREKLYSAIEKHFERTDEAESMESDEDVYQKRHHTCKNDQERDDDNSHKLHATSEKKPFYKVSELRKHSKKDTTKNNCDGKASPIAQWKERLHFASMPLYKFGNWIPYALMRWPCFGNDCAVAQIEVKSEDGEELLVSKRLDARYDWLPSPYTTVGKFSHYEIRYYGTACHAASSKWAKKSLRKPAVYHHDAEKDEGNEDDDHGEEQQKKKNRKKRRKKKMKIVGKLALVSGSGNCTFFKKIYHAATAGFDGVVIYPKHGEPIRELRCYKKHCFLPLYISASMISHSEGTQLRHLLSTHTKLTVNFQYTPQENFFLAIDGQGKLAEVGLFLFPSLQFLAYEATWFNYKTDLIHNLTGSAKIIHVFNYTIMKGEKGAVRTIHLPPLKELLMYRNVELDMSLHCESSSDYSCPHWDHVVLLTVCCDEGNALCGEELGRWITPYKRGIGRWLTRITPLLPLFTSDKCKLQMRHPFWERAWYPSLDIRLSDHIKYSKHHYSGKQEDEFIVPYKLVKLFKGGMFKSGYNKKYQPFKFETPSWTERVKLVATITGHGSDNHGCAEFCVTSHHFIVNGNENVNIFKNAATATGCADRIAQGVEPNEHGTWLYGRNGWCCGQDVVPWVKDITDQVDFDEVNIIRYHGWFNGMDPNPTRNPGEIIMSSYLVFYRSSDEVH